MNNRKKILIAPDSFKESLTSEEVIAAVIDGFQNNNKFDFEYVTLADGGEGTTKLITSLLNGTLIETKTKDPLGRLIDTYYGLSGDGKTAIVDVATSSGIELLTQSEKNPIKASSFGTGQLINHALENDVDTIILGLGSSATVDLGFGMLSCLGVKFFDENNVQIDMCSNHLSDVIKIDTTNINPKIMTTKFIVACDVDNVLTGNDGSCHTFAKQKGASPQQIEQLESEFIRLNEQFKKQFIIDLNQIDGSGAAGGIGGSAFAFLNARLVSGSELIIDIGNIESKIEQSNVVITGEGYFDSQSIHGKGPMTIIRLAQKHNKKIIVFCGALDNSILELEELENVAVFPTISKVDSLEATLENAYNNVKYTARSVSKLL